MGHLKFFTTLILSILMISCDDEDSNREREEQNLNELLSKIHNMANSSSCNDPADWHYTSYGSKACGGPVGYIAFPVTIDTIAFLEMVAKHKKAQQEFNERWDISSDCSSPAAPKVIACDNGNPVFQY